jgi:ribosomal protein S18 acetylase RimI-like enzyme
MKDIPAFTTENGIASLILREIPYREEAYIRIQSSLSPEALVEECAQFCTMCGAEKVYATGHEFLEQYPLHTAVLQMRCDVAAIPDTDAALFPVQEKTAAQWRQLYNERMRHVPNAAWMTEKDELEMLRKGDGYFVHRNGELLGIGRASGEKIDLVIAAKRGAGFDVMCALRHALSADTAVLEVASVNEKAIHLYSRMGFVPSKELSRWYQVR